MPTSKTLSGQLQHHALENPCANKSVRLMAVALATQMVLLSRGSQVPGGNLGVSKWTEKVCIHLCRSHGLLTRYANLRVAHSPGMPGNRFPATAG